MNERKEIILCNLNLNFSCLKLKKFNFSAFTCFSNFHLFANAIKPRLFLSFSYFPSGNFINLKKPTPGFDAVALACGFITEKKTKVIYAEFRHQSNVNEKQNCLLINMKNQFESVAIYRKHEELPFTLGKRKIRMLFDVVKLCVGITLPADDEE